MSNENVEKESILNTLFECRGENLYALTEKDKEKIATVKLQSLVTLSIIVFATSSFIKLCIYSSWIYLNQY